MPRHLRTAVVFDRQDIDGHDGEETELVSGVVDLANEHVVLDSGLHLMNLREKTQAKDALLEAAEMAEKLDEGELGEVA